MCIVNFGVCFGMDGISEKPEKVTFRETFNFKDSSARARIFMLLSVSIQTALVYVTTGIFFTGFLSENGIDIYGNNILMFVPYVAGLFSLVAPEILSRFKKRKLILAFCMFFYYAFLLGGVNLIPLVIEDSVGKLWGMVVVSFIANLFYVIGTAGYNAWHVRFIPERIRSYYLSCSQISAALIAGIFALVSGQISDYLASIEGGQLQFLINLRYVSIGIGAIQCICLMIPKEVEYPVIRTPHIADVISIPVKNRKFMMTMLIVFFWNFSAQLSATSLAFYLLNTVGMSYTFYNIIIFLYSPIFFLSAPLWRRLIEKTSWFKTFAWAVLLVGPAQIVYGFIQPGNYIVISLVVRCIQHFAGAGHNVAFANFMYINMPVTNRTCYTSFYNIVFQSGALTGLLCGMGLMALTENISFSLFGYTYQAGVPFLIMLTGVFQILIAIYVLAFRKRLEPDPEIERA